MRGYTVVEYTGGSTGASLAFVCAAWDYRIRIVTSVDEILPVRTDDAKEMARRMARKEGLFAGTSSGANVIAAIQVAE